MRARKVVGLLVALALGGTLLVANPVGSAAPTEAPSIVSPTGGEEVTSNPILSWSPLPDVARYRVQVSAAPSFSPTLWTADAYNTSATPPGDLPLGALYWRVAGLDGSSVGPYASAQFVRKRADAPTPLAPANGEVLPYPSEPVVLRWTAVPGAKTYRVELDDAADFIGAQSIVTDVPNWALLTTQQVGQTFHWRVQAQGVGSGVNTAFSATQTYSLAWATADGTPLVPTLLEPAPDQVVSDVAFRWSAVPGAARYQIQVSPNGDWANNVTIDETVKGTSYSRPVTLNNASYFWRVRALSVRNPADSGPWSPDGRQFTRQWSDEPILVSPANDDLAAAQFLLQWDPVPFASAYEVQVGSEPNFSPGTYTTCTTNHTDVAPTWYESSPPSPVAPPAGSILPGGCDLGRNESSRLTYARQGVRYYWRVRGIDQSQASTTPTVLGRFSEVRNFMYLPSAHGTPQPIAPTSGATVAVPTLRWTGVHGVEQYEVRVSRGSSTVQVGKTYGTSYTPSLSLPSGQSSADFTWTVRALQHKASGGSSNAGGGPVVTGTPFTLTTESTDGTEPTLVAPGEGEAVLHPEFDWTPVDGAHHYEVRLAARGSSVYTTLVDHNEGSGATRHPWRSAFTPTTVIAPGEYDWHVVAFNSSNGIISTSDPQHVTVRDLDVAVPTAPADCVDGGECTAERSTPLLQWEPVEAAAFYRVYLALDDAFTNVVRVYRTHQSSLRPMEALPDNQAGQSYHWFVRPCRSESSCGRFDSSVYGSARAFRKQSRPIALLSPQDGAQVADLTTFSWSAPSSQWADADANDDVEARTYRIQVSTTPQFAAILDSAEVDQRTYTPHEDTYPEGPLYWRVQARDASGNYLTLSEVRRVDKVSTPLTVTSPLDGASVNGVPLVEWDAQPFAAKYEVEYYKNDDRNWTPSNRIQTTSTQVNADTMVEALPLGTYAYRVRRLDVDGRAGPWSAGRSFQVVGAAPSPTAPTAGQVFSRPRVRLEWDPVPGAVQYRVETSTSAAFASSIESQVTVMTAWSLVKSHPNGTIHWRVSALDPQGNVLGTSTARSFVHDLTRPAAAITRATAGPGSVLLTWSATAASAVGPISSFVVTAYAGTTVAATRTVDGADQSVVFAGLVNDTKYRFTVTPHDSDGRGTESPKSAEVTPRKVAPFSTIDRFVTQQFRDIYGRGPTSTELSTWRSRLQGSTTPEAMIESLWGSPPHRDVVPPIARLYRAYFLRPPDQAGMAYWTGRMRAGTTSISGASSFFAGSTEFRNRYGRLTNRQFVEQVYRNVLGRNSDPAGVSFWTSELDRGRRSRGRVMIGFSESGEYQRKSLADINAALILITFLGRTPTSDEQAALVDRFRAGDTFTEVVPDVLALPEYAERVT